VNGHLIPVLCAKANIPLQDAIGKIAGHRARTTIATALYNAPEGLSIDELAQWLGHKDVRSTQPRDPRRPTDFLAAQPIEINLRPTTPVE